MVTLKERSRSTAQCCHDVYICASYCRYSEVNPEEFTISQITHTNETSRATTQREHETKLEVKIDSTPRVHDHQSQNSRFPWQLQQTPVAEEDSDMQLKVPGKASGPI